MKSSPFSVIWTLVGMLAFAQVVQANDSVTRNVELMLASAAGDDDRFATVLDVAITTWPEHKEAILSIAGNLKPDGALPDAVVVAALPEETPRTPETHTDQESGFFNPGAWDGEINAGGSNANGNSDQQSLSLAAKLKRDFGDDYSHEINLRGDFARTDGSTSQQRFAGEYEFTAKISEKFLLTNIFKGETDSFTSYEYRLFDTVNIAHQFIDTETHKLRLELGGGVRYTTSRDLPATWEPILRTGLLYEKSLHEKLAFNERLSVVMGKETTTLNSLSEITSQINHSLSLRVGLEMLYDTNVTAPAKKLDTISRLSVVYSF